MQSKPTVQTRQVTTATVDVDAGKLQWLPCEGASLVRLGASGDKPNAIMTAYIVFWDEAGSMAGVTEVVTFTVQSTVKFGSTFLAIPDHDAWFPNVGASWYSVYVPNVSGGNWVIQSMTA